MLVFFIGVLEFDLLEFEELLEECPEDEDLPEEDDDFCFRFFLIGFFFGADFFLDEDEDREELEELELQIFLFFAGLGFD